MTDLTNLLQILAERVGYFTRLDSYYYGTQPLAFLAPEAKEALGSRLTTMNSNVCRLAVTSLAERLRVTGFTADGHPDEQLWAAWRRNDLDQTSAIAHREALALGKSYVIVWADQQGRAKVTIESARQVAAVHDPGTREVVGAVKRWEADNATHAIHYGPERITRYKSDALGATTTGFRVVETIDNPLGVVPVTAIRNGDRLLDDGVSEMADLLPLVDAQSKLLGDMLVGSEYYARPRRWATGVELTTDPETGEALNPFTEGVKMMISEDPESRFGSLPAADLAAYESAVKVLTAQIMAVSGLPAHYVGVLSNQPASADALRAAEASLTARAEARQATFGRAWERVARLILAVENEVDPQSVSPSIVWADPATRSVAQEADAVVKLFQAGILPATYALKKLGYADDEIAAIRSARRAEALDGQAIDLKEIAS